MSEIYNYFIGLADPTVQDNKKKFTIRASNKGPVGTPDSYQLFAENEANAWYVAEAAPQQKKKKILFADPVMGHRAKEGYEYELWDELIAQHAVFIWDESNGLIRTQNAVQSSAEFMQECGRAKGHTKEEIRKALAAQGLDPDEYIILDTQHYYNYMDQTIKQVDSRESFVNLTLGKLCNDLPLYLDTHYCDKQCIELIRNLRPTVTRMTDLEIDEANDIIEICTNEHTDPIDCNKLVDNPTKLTINQFEVEREIINIPDSVEELTVCYNNVEGVKSLDLTHLPNLKSLRIRRPQNANNDNVTVALKVNQVTSLEIDGINLLDFDMRSCASLESLIICNTNTIPSALPISLKVLSLQGVCSERDLDLSHIDHMYSVELVNCNYNSLTLPTKVNTIYLSDVSLRSNFLDLSNVSKCYEMSVIETFRCTPIREVILPKEIGSVTLEHCKELAQLSGYSSSGIHNLHLKDCPILSKFEATPASLEYLYAVSQQSSCCPDVTKSNIKYLNLPGPVRKKAKPPNQPVEAAAISNDQALNERNQRHPTSLVKLHRSITPGVTRGGLVTSDYSGNEIKVTGYSVDSKGDFNVDFMHYRVSIIDEVLLDNGVLRFQASHQNFVKVEMSHQLFDEERTVSILKSGAQEDTSSIAFDIEVRLAPGQVLPIAAQCPLFHINGSHLFCSDDLDWYYSHEKQQYFVSLKPNEQEKLVKIGYLHKKDSLYQSQTSDINDAKLVVSEQQLLPDALFQVLQDIFRTTPKLSFMIDDTLSLNEKLLAIIAYCKAFTPKESLDTQVSDSIQILINQMLEQSGSCQDRSEVFVVLTRYLQIKANMIDNGSHAFGEIPYELDGVTKFAMSELGGRESFDLTPEKDRVNQFEKAKHLNPVAAKHERPTTKDIFTQVHLFHSVHDVKRTHLLSPLLILEPGQEAIATASALMNESESNALYIHSPADLKRLLKTVVIRDGKRINQPGPLYDLLKQGGLLIINWNTFTPNEIASYKSILEENGTLMGIDVSAKVNIISLIDHQAQKRCESFVTRVSRCQLDSDYLHHHKPVPPNSERGVIDIDLFHSPNWRERLLGKVVRDGKQYQLIEGKLLEALRSGQTLQIYNAPDDPALQAMLNQIKHTGKFYFNGEMISNKFLNYSLSHRENSLSTDNVKVITDATSDDGRRIYLNANNIRECYERLLIDNDTHSAGKAPGYFQTETEFCISGYIPKGAWQELISMAQHFPDKRFTFRLLPGAEIEDVATGPQPGISTKPCNVILTNDPDFYCLSATGNPLIIDVTPDTSYQDLIADLLDRRDDDGNIDFTLEPKAMLLALLGNRNVIINGQVNSILYQQLMPFLDSQHAKIMLNGIEQNITGNLQIVMPLSAKGKLNPSQWREHEFYMDDYRHHFNKHDQANLDKVKRLYHYAKSLDHKNLDKLPPALNYANLKNMLTTLNRPEKLVTHSSNPLKGWLNLDYPKNSPHYAFLNVLAKFYFAPKVDEHKVRVHKIKQFIKAHHIRTREEAAKFAWELLNCCNVGMIRKCLWELSEKPIEFKDGKPILPTTVMDELFRYIQLQDLLPTQPNERDKAAKKFQQLMHNPDVPAIFLKGPPGTSKTHTINRFGESLPKEHYFKGDDQIISWLTAKSSDGSPVLLHLDEANLALPGSWDIFKGLFRNQPIVYYKGKEYPISKQHKVIFTGNDESMPGRHRDRFFEHYAEKVYFPMPSKEWINETFFLPTFKRLHLPANEAELFNQQFMWAFHHIKEYNPYIELSLRNIISMLNTFEHLYTPHSDIKQLIYDVCRLEFASEIQKPASRSEFLNTMQMRLRLLPGKDKQEMNAIIEVGGLTLPIEKKYIIEAMQHDLAMCEANASTGHYRRGVLLEGDSGLGKSSLCKAILEDRGYRKEHQDPPKRYYEISVDNSSNIPETLIRAFLEGSKVVLDELNLSKDIEGLLNELFEGKLPSDKKFRSLMSTIAGTDHPAIKPGFQVYTSQNAGSMEGRNPLSPAIRNRTHMIHFDPYTAKELVNILAQHNIPHPDIVVSQFLAEMKREPGVINTRNLFAWMKRVEAEIAVNNYDGVQWIDEVIKGKQDTRTIFCESRDTMRLNH